MKQIYLTLAFVLLATAGAFAQFNATITVTELGSGLPVPNAIVELDGNFLATDPTGQVVFAGLADNSYDYFVSATCYNSGPGSITIAGADATSSVALDPIGINNVFFFVGSPLTIPGATVQLWDAGTFNETIITGAILGDLFENVPFGEYSYSITLPCYEPVSGTVMVDCNNGDGIAVFAEPVEATTNGVFFFVGSPLAITGATVQLWDAGTYNTTIVTSDPFGGDMIADVPFGEYSYSITLPCYEPVSGTVMVDCNNGDGIAVFAEPVEATTNGVFFFVGSPLAITGATVQLWDAGTYNTTIVTSDPFGGDMIADVPFGEYSYSITLPCYEPVSGTVMVDCNNGDGIAVFAEPVEATTNGVFFFVGSPLAITGATVQLWDAGTYNTTIVTSDPFGGDMIADVPFGEYSYSITLPCYEPVSGTVIVDCNNGDGIAVFAEPVEVVIDLTVTADDATLTATASGMDYQWVDCNNNNEPIIGANDQSFTATENGSYAVIITSGDCAQTSDCTAITILGTSDLTSGNTFVVYPNPFAEVITVRTNGQAGPLRVELFNLSGQRVIDEMKSAVETITVHTADLTPGSYVLRLTSGTTRTTMRVVK
ncbi:MAG: T9SS type A sorting domain-containing protein [Flavobacteriales bacterium]|nr:T9SS type A sorting domain-containing protein [Flavobacteriales bacterium]